MIYKLSPSGRKIPYFEWRKAGGCGLPNNTNAMNSLGPMAHWDTESITLGQIEDACPQTGRGLARFAIEHLGMPEMSVPYESQSYPKCRHDKS